MTSLHRTLDGETHEVYTLQLSMAIISTQFTSPPPQTSLHLIPLSERPQKLLDTLCLMYVLHVLAESLSGGSLIIVYQLENKLTAHTRLMQFLVDCGVLEKVREREREEVGGMGWVGSKSFA